MVVSERLPGIGLPQGASKKRAYPLGIAVFVVLASVRDEERDRGNEG